MANENENPMDDKITLEIARELAGKGNYDEAIELLSPLIHSEFSVEALNLLAKIHAQRQDFENAEKYFNDVLKQDKNNQEALSGLKKCQELKNSKVKTYFSFNKLKVYSIVAVIVLIMIVGAIGIVSFSSNNTTSPAAPVATVSGSDSSYISGVADAESDLITISFKDNGNSEGIIADLNYLNSSDLPIDIVKGDGDINVTSNPAGMNEILYILNYDNVIVNSVTFNLSKDSTDKAVDEASNIAIDNAKANGTNTDGFENVASEVIPNTITYEDGTYLSSQYYNIESMMNHENGANVKVISVLKI